MTETQIIKDIAKLFIKDVNGTELPKTKHPINFFFRDEFDDFNTDAVWDVLHDKWIKPIQSVDQDFDIKSKFPTVWFLAEELAQAWDIELGSLKRELVDYNELISVLSSSRHRQTLEELLYKLVVHISSDIEDLCNDYTDLHNKRLDAFSMDPEEIRAQWKGMYDDNVPKWLNSKNWTPANLEYKLLQKWQYLSLLAHLKQVWLDNDTSLKTKLENIQEIL